MPEETESKELVTVVVATFVVVAVTKKVITINKES